MKSFGKIMVGMMMGASVLAVSAASASAAIVCSGNECWHTHDAFEYPREAHVIVHPDNWRWGPRDHYTWHEHEGRGYWLGGAWRAF
jgi:calcineurin-like phosphoesterase